MSIFNRRAKLISSIIVLSLLFIGFMSANTGVVNAEPLWPPQAGGYPLNPNPWGSIPWVNLSNLNTDCQFIPKRSPGFTQWISPQGAPSATSISVPYGTSSINLEYHFVGAVCWGNSAVTDTYTYVDSAWASPSGSVSGIVGNTLHLNFNPHNVVGTYRQDVRLFNYAPSGGFTTSGTYWVNLGVKTINRFTSGRYFCVPSGGEIGGPGSIGSCPTGTPGFPIEVTVLNEPPEGNLDVANCSVVSGWARDPDRPNQALQVRVYQDALPAFGGRLVQQVTANQFRSDVGAHGFSVNVSSYSDAYFHNYYATAFDANTGVEYFIGGNPKGAGPCAPPSCNSNAVISPGTPEVGESFSANVGFSYTPGSNGRPLKYDIIINAVGAVGTPATTPDAFAPPSYNQTASGFTQSSAGTHEIRWRIRWNNNYSPGSPVNVPEQNVLCTDEYLVVVKPYLKIYGNDIWAGGYFADPAEINQVFNPSNYKDCTNVSASSLAADAQDAVIKSHNKIFAPQSNAPRVVAGASVAYGQYATGQIFPFGSFDNRDIYGRQSYALTFANADLNENNYSGANADQRGYYPTQPRCISNYYNVLEKDALPAPPGTGALGGGQYFSSGNLVIGGYTVNAPTTIIVDGDVTITGDINMTDGPWGTTDNIPVFVLVVRGDIDINPTVTRLDGIYIAQGDPDDISLVNKGVIDTCGIGVTSLSTTSCNSKLNIFGAFVAQRVNFTRTFGALSDIVSSGDDQAAPSAEQFNFSPELYLGNPYFIFENPPQSTTTLPGTYQVKDLPPVL